jgi:hypothetical protein
MTTSRSRSVIFLHTRSFSILTGYNVSLRSFTPVKTELRSQCIFPIQPPSICQNPIQFSSSVQLSHDSSHLPL